MRYYFDVDGEQADDEGIEFSDFREALKAATDSLPDMAYDPFIAKPERVQITVRDEGGPICKVSMESYRRVL